MNKLMFAATIVVTFTLSLTAGEIGGVDFEQRETGKFIVSDPDESGKVSHWTRTGAADGDSEVVEKEDNKYLKIDESGVLARSFEGGATNIIANGGIQIKSKIQFTAQDAEDAAPAIADGAKIALWASKDAEGVKKLMVTAGLELGDTTLTNFVTNITLENDDAEWYDLEVKSEMGSNGAIFKIKVDGKDVTAMEGEMTSFQSLVAEGETKWQSLESIAFKGTGAADDLEFSDYINEQPVKFYVAVTPAEAEEADVSVSFDGAEPVPYTPGFEKLMSSFNERMTILATCEGFNNYSNDYTKAQIEAKVDEGQVDITIEMTAASTDPTTEAALNDAIAAVAAGGTVKLGDNINLTKPLIIASGKVLTLDLGGKKLTSPGWGINNSGTLTLKNGTIEAREAAITLYGNSVTTIESGTYTSTDNAVIMGQGSEGNGNVTLTVNGGTFNGSITTTGYIACGLYAPNSGTYALNGGTFNITGGCGVCARAGTTTIGKDFAIVLNNTGTVSGWVGDKKTAVPGVQAYFDWTIPPYPGYEEGDTIISATKLGTSDDEVWFEGEEGYVLGLKSNVTAQIGDANYATLDDAIAAAESGAEITLMKDVTIDKTAAIKINKNITLNFGDKIVTKTVANDYVFDIANGATVLFKGTTGGVKQTASNLNPDWPASMIRNKGNLTIDGGVYTSDFCIIKNDEDPGAGTLTVLGGTFNMVRTEGGYAGTLMSLMNWSTATINGGTWNGGSIYTRSCDGNAVSKAGTTEITTTLAGNVEYILAVGYPADTTCTNLPKIKGVDIEDVTIVKASTLTDDIQLTKSGDYISAVANPVAYINNVYYGTFDAALAAAPEGAMITLYKDISTAVAQQWTLDKSITIDFDDKKITKTVANDWVFTIAAGADVTFMGTSGGIVHKPAKLNQDYPASMIQIIGKLTVYGGEYESDYTVFKVDDNGTTAGELVIKGGKVTITDEPSYTGKTFAVMSWYKTTINGGVINGNVVALSYDGAIKPSEVTINAGATVSSACFYQNGANDTTCGTIKIADSLELVPTIMKGVTGNAVTSTTEVGYKAYTLVAGAAKIGDTYYVTLADAVKAATAGQTITLTKDYSGAGLFIEPDQTGITLDLGGFTYTAGAPAAGSSGTMTQALHIEASGVTVKNGTIACAADNYSKTWLATDTVKGVSMLVQNHGTGLTLKDVVLDGSNLAQAYYGTGEARHAGTTYTLSCYKAVDVTLDGATIKARTNDTNTVAFEVYPAGTSITVTSATVKGNIELGGGNMTVTAINLDGNLTGSMGNGVIIDNSKSIKAPEGYKWNSDNKLVAIDYATLTITQVANCSIVVSNLTEEVAVETGAKFDKDLETQLTVYRAAAEGYELDDCAAVETITMTADQTVTAKVKEVTSAPVEPGNDGTEVTDNKDGTVTIEPNKTIPGQATITLNDTTTKIMVTSTINTLNVSGQTPAAGQIKVLSGNGTDITSVCKMTTTGNTIDVSLDEAKVTPTAAEAEASEGKIADGVVKTEAVVGLNYTLQRMAELGGEKTQVDAERATTTSVTLKDETTKPADKAFYVIEVTK